jgi:hypothetical protein
LLDSKRLINTILDHMLQLLPADPAVSKRLDDIGDPEPATVQDPPSNDSGYPESGVHTIAAARMAS